MTSVSRVYLSASDRDVGSCPSGRFFSFAFKVLN